MRRGARIAQPASVPIKTVHRIAVAEQVIGLAIRVHRALGPGLLESSYGECLAYEFADAGLEFESQARIPVSYREVQIDCGYRADFVVEGSLLLEIKSVERLLPVHDAQVMTCLKLSKLNQALLLNFNVPRLIDGLKSFLPRPNNV